MKIGISLFDTDRSMHPVELAQAVEARELDGLFLPQHDPIWLAKQIASLDYLTGGRVVLGVGYGWNREQGESHGVTFSSRRPRFEEYLATMRALWTQEAAAFRGDHVSLEPAWCYPKPAQPGGPPIIVGGMGPKTFDAIAQTARSKWST